MSDERGTGTIASIMIPAEGPIYWSVDEISRLIFVLQNNRSAADPRDAARMIANETVKILRERNLL